jgi:anti-sigma B factor antagonist
MARTAAGSRHEWGWHSTPLPPVTREVGRTIVSLRGELDAITLSMLDGILTTEVAARPVDLVIDLSDVTFIDASTVGALLRCRNLLRVQSRRLTLRSPSGCVSRLFALCGLSDLLDAPSPVGGLVTPEVV